MLLYNWTQMEFLEPEYLRRRYNVQSRRKIIFMETLLQYGDNNCPEVYQ